MQSRTIIIFNTNKLIWNDSLYNMFDIAIIRLHHPSDLSYKIEAMAMMRFQFKWSMYPIHHANIYLRLCRNKEERCVSGDYQMYPLSSPHWIYL